MKFGEVIESSVLAFSAVPQTDFCLAFEPGCLISGSAVNSVSAFRR